MALARSLAAAASGACTARDNFGSCAHESTDPVVVVVCDANDPLDFI